MANSTPEPPEAGEESDCILSTSTRSPDPATGGSVKVEENFFNSHDSTTAEATGMDLINLVRGHDVPGKLGTRN